MIEARDNMVADEVLHVAFHGEAEVIGQVNIRPISDNGRVLKLNWKFFKQLGLRAEEILQLDLAITVDLHHSIISSDNERLRSGNDRKVSVLEVTCHQVLALGFLHSRELEVALVKSVNMLSEYHGSVV